MTADRNSRIQQRAYHLWLEEGQPHGRDEEHWHRAERELIEEERRLGEGLPATDAPAADTRQAAPARAEDRPDNKSPTAVQEKAKPRAPRSRPAATGSGSRVSRRPAAAKSVE